GRITSVTTAVLASLLLVAVLGGTSCLGVCGGMLFNEEELNNGAYRLFFLVPLYESWAALWGTSVLCMVWLFVVLALSRGRNFHEERDAGRVLVRRRPVRSIQGHGFWSGVSLFDQKKVAAEPEREPEPEPIEMTDVERQQRQGELVEGPAGESGQAADLPGAKPARPAPQEAQDVSEEDTTASAQEPVAEPQDRSNETLSDGSSNYEDQSSSSSSSDDSFDEPVTPHGPFEALRRVHGSDRLDTVPECSEPSDEVQSSTFTWDMPLPPRIRPIGRPSSTLIAPPLHSPAMQGLGVVSIGGCSPSSPLRQVEVLHSSSEDLTSVPSVPRPARCRDHQAAELVGVREMSPLTALAQWASSRARGLEEGQEYTGSEERLDALLFGRRPEPR
ncbi:hypothetical protein KEM56_006691, partial [Ascosphaera pollenicola]